MKLNLLPATVSRGRQSKTAWVAAVVIIFVGIGISLALTITSKEALEQARQEYDASIGPAQRAANTSAKVESYMSNPDVVALVKNVSLGEAMISHNDVYPALYNSLLPYIPPFFRLTSLAATPMSDAQASVTMTGTLTSYQQYADLMLALMRNPAAVSVARSGYQSDEQYVPNLTETDQFGKPRIPGQAPIPDDPLQRLAYFQANAQPSGVYTGVGGFGSGTTNTRGPMEGESLVTVQLVLNAPLQTPNPRATLGGGGGTGGGGGFPGGGGPPPGMVPGRPGGGGPGGPPAGPGGPAPAPGAPGGGKGRGIDD